MGNSHNHFPAPSGCADVQIISSDDNWIEGAAVQQLHKTAELKGMLAVAGMPDLHPGRGYPIGAAFFSKDKIYPALVGNDIGCGMALWQTDMKLAKLNLDKLAKRLTDVESPLDDSWNAAINQGKADKKIRQHGFDMSLGTIGGGNHFAEFQALDRIDNQAEFDAAGFNKKALLLLVHSGSRGLGQQVLTEHIQQFNHDGLVSGTAEFDRYISAHNEAVCWAELNRQLIAQRFLQAIKTSGEQRLDINHNTVLATQINGVDGWLHRKGATPSDQGLVVIPGSRGDYSYLVKPLATSGNKHLSSLAHGAGRKWARGDCKQRLQNRYHKDDLLRTQLGSRVICADKTLLYDEAPEAYKHCDDIIQSLVEEQLIEPVARLRPVLTFKTQGACGK